ncbi:MAG TPA: addiction module protein [Chthoniobacteraceae bacterium]|jgi:putative addiction module component (TIGR02574 family)|nr:addiction module protein [Chthoniobacteraceae bacterium]
MSLADLPQVQQLTDRRKLELIDEIWDSIDSAWDDAPLAPWQQQKLAERLAADAARPDDVLGLDEFKQRLRASM